LFQDSKNTSTPPLNYLFGCVSSELADYDEAPVAAHLKGQEITIEVDLGLGEGRATVWTCDLTHGYIAINADYRS
jgi:N-acetylglutamate synthase/N-acetylornithine aminotransferase